MSALNHFAHASDCSDITESNYMHSYMCICVLLPSQFKPLIWKNVLMKFVRH